PASQPRHASLDHLRLHLALPHLCELLREAHRIPPPRLLVKFRRPQIHAHVREPTLELRLRSPRIIHDPGVRVLVGPSQVIADRSKRKAVTPEPQRIHVTIDRYRPRLEPRDAEARAHDHGPLREPTIDERVDHHTLTHAPIARHRRFPDEQ